MSDLEFQNFSTVQSVLQPKPVTMAAAATIAPSTFLTFLSGATAVATITPPVTGCHMLALCFTATNGTTVTTGNILTAYSAVQNRPVLLIYDPVQAKYLVQTVA